MLRRLTLSGLTVLLAAAALLDPAAASAQTDDDDWDFTETPTSVIASVAYDGGRTLGVRCANHGLEVLITGLPPTTTPAAQTTTRNLSVSADRTPFTDQTWLVAPGSPVAYSARPGFAARFLRSARQISIRPESSEPGIPVQRLDFDLPATSRNIDRVLSACDTPLSDPRDLISEFDRPDGDSHARLWRRLPELTALYSAPANSFVVISCIIGPAKSLTDCRPEVINPPNARLGAQSSLAVQRASLRPDAPVQEGRLLVMLATRHAP